MIKKDRCIAWLGFATGISAAMIFLSRWNRQFLKVQVKDRVIDEETGLLGPCIQVQVSTLLECPADVVWQLVLTSGLMVHLSWPWISYTPEAEADLPAIWQAGQKVEVQLRFLDIIPLGWHRIEIEKIDSEPYALQTRESGLFIEKWDHKIQLVPTRDGATVYEDSLDIWAGPKTSGLACLGSCLLRYRQARLRKLAGTLIDGTPPK